MPMIRLPPCRHIAIKTSKLFVKSSGTTLSILIRKLPVNRYHSFLHRLDGLSASPVSFISNFSSKLINILQLDGSMEVNLFLFLIFSRYLSCPQLHSEIFARLKSQLPSNTSQHQLALINLLLGHKDVWLELIEYDLNTACWLSSQLSCSLDSLCADSYLLELIKYKNTLKYYPTLPNTKYLITLYSLEDLEKFSKKLQRLIILHHEFCNLRTSKSKLHKFTRTYSKLVKSAEHGTIPKVFFDDLLFYRELSIVNQYNLLQGDASRLAERIEIKECATENEKKIKQAILCKLKYLN